MKRLIIIVMTTTFIFVSVHFGLPAFAQTYLATKLPRQPLSSIAAEQIILHSGLPIEILPDGTTNAVTKGRDVVNAYRYAHAELYKNGWYRGISDDHIPLLIAMVAAIEKEGFTSSNVTLQGKTEEVLRDFWDASNTQNVNELGFNSLADLSKEVVRLKETGKIQESNQLREAYNEKWN